MAKYYETLYKYAQNRGMTTNSINARLKHIDDRLDALEKRMPSSGSGTVAATGHTHTYNDRIGIFLPGKLTLADIGPALKADTAMTVKTVSAACRLNSASATAVIDVQKSTDRGATWTSILTAYINIEPGELTSETASTQPAVNSAAATLTAGTLLRLYVVTADAAVIDPCVTIKSEIATSA